MTHAVLGSYAVQSDLGDFDIDDHGEGFDYIKDMRFMPNQGEDLLEEIAATHRQQKYVFFNRHSTRFCHIYVQTVNNYNSNNKFHDSFKV